MGNKENLRVICIYPGRFQPFHKSHYKVYQYLVGKFGKSNVYISTSNKVQQKSPFDFKQKQLIISKMFGINKSNIINNNQPYKAQNFSSLFNPKTTVLVYASTQKDNRLKAGNYFKGTLQKDPKPYSQQAYWINVPLMDNKILGQQVSGTSVRNIFKSKELTLQQKKKVFIQLFGKFDKYIFQLIINKLGGNIHLQTIIHHNKKLLQGGRSGHLPHPFQDNNLTFNDFKQLITNILSGQITVKNGATIKYDGKNIFVTWKNGKMLAARNGGQTKNFGQNAMDVNGTKNFFSGRGVIQKAFTYAMIDLQRAFSKLSSNRLKKIFNQGRNWINLQIIYDESQHDIPYDRSMLIFHAIVQVDQKGNTIREANTSVSDIYSCLVQVNSNIQKHFEIQGPSFVTLPKSQNFQKDKSYFLGKLKSLQSQYNLSGTNTLLDYHRAYWTKVITSYASNMQYNIPNNVLEGLLKRWAQLDKSYSINNIKKQCDNPKFLQWVLKFDKADHMRQYKINCSKWQMLFLQLGAKILKNLSTFMLANPDKAVKKIKDQLDSIIKTIQSSNNIQNIAKMQTQLNKINSIGGLQSIVPTQGIVFNYKGNKYKITGIFAPVHQIMSLVKFAK